MRLFLPLSLVCGTALAQTAGAPADVVRYRQYSMKAIGTHMKALAALANEKVTMPGQAALHAKSVAELSATMKDWFPKGTGAAATETDAKGEVWSDEAKFARAVAQMKTRAEALVEAASGPPAKLKAALSQVEEECSSCHKAFRAGR